MVFGLQGFFVRAVMFAPLWDKLECKQTLPHLVGYELVVHNRPSYLTNEKLIVRVMNLEKGFAPHPLSYL